jgi:biotin synthase
MIRDNGFVILGAEDAFDGDEQGHDPAIRHRGAGTEVPANA